MHLLEACEVIFKYDEKGRKGQKASAVSERKINNMHLLKSCKAKHKIDVKIDGKGIESDGKKVEKAREG
jgi:hypothetical protein